MNSEQVSEKSGIPYRTLMRLVEKGILRPEREPHSTHNAYVWNLAEVSKAMRPGAKLREAAELRDAVFRGDF